MAIQGDDARRHRLGFVPDRDQSSHVTPNICPLGGRQVRLLDGAHTAMVPPALLAGCEPVREAVREGVRVGRIGACIRPALVAAIIPTLDVPELDAHARAVLDRFDNPDARHSLRDITHPGTMTLHVRVLPSIAQHARTRGVAPGAPMLGFAAHLWLLHGAMHAARRTDGLGAAVVRLCDGGAISVLDACVSRRGHRGYDASVRAPA